ncbi:hypothetical protein EYF80_042029 [Liparis tanakae]|uniref:Uncharacterized protein n=1 Tax=Liparis tanakae TaxID=230148 RepID=A0A4Z2G2I9_9TELE|nr:hypothetical protein EYF80_042029 [Liparis tanakae]
MRDTQRVERIYRLAVCREGQMKRRGASARCPTAAASRQRDDAWAASGAASEGLVVISWFRSFLSRDAVTLIIFSLIGWNEPQPIRSESFESPPEETDY